MIPNLSLGDALSSMPCSHVIRIISRADRPRILEIQKWAESYPLPRHVQDALSRRLAELFPHAPHGRGRYYAELGQRVDAYGEPLVTPPPSLVDVATEQAEVMVERAELGLRIWHPDGDQITQPVSEDYGRTASRHSGHHGEPSDLREQRYQQQVDALDGEEETGALWLTRLRKLRGEPIHDGLPSAYADIARRRWEHYLGW